MLRNLLILTLGLSLPATMVVACNDDDDDNGSDDGGDDDGGDDGGNDDGGNDDGGNDDGGNDDGGNDDGGNDDGGNDDGSSSQCEQPSDCPVVHCNCESGIVNYSNCDNGRCGTESDCAGVCQSWDEDEDDGEDDGGGEGDGGGEESGGW